MSKYRILSLCGGGVRGIMTATILERLELEHPGFLDSIDLMAGTSAGSNIISLLLGDYSAKDIGQRFRDFLVHYQPEKRNNTDPSRPMYNIQDFVDALTVLHPGNPPLKHFKQQFLMTSFQLGDSKDFPHWNQIIFNNLRHSDNAKVGIVDATVSSCVMGGMFGVHQFHYKHGPIYTVDGAFAHHDPTLIAIAFAIQEGHALEDIVVVDIGTGFMPQSLPGERVKDWGAQQWTYANNKDALVPPLLTNQPFSMPVFDMILNGTNTTMVEDLARMMLPKRFVNINPHIRNISETDNTAIPYLIEKGLEVDLHHANKLIRKQWF